MGRGLDGYLNYLTLKALCSFQAPPGRSRKIPVAHSEWETPLPIPNRAVKPLCADGTWGATPWESRSPPVLLTRAAHRAALCRRTRPGICRRTRPGTSGLRRGLGVRGEAVDRRVPGPAAA